MGKITGFLEWQRIGALRRDAESRVNDSREFYFPMAKDELERQAGRCMDCGVPVCQQGCPLGNMIPDWNDLVYRGRYREAYDRLAATNTFPELTGRLCPAPCEPACVLAINGSPVTIEQIEKEIIEKAFASGWVKPEPPQHRTGKTVAVVGSGPAGLAAAHALNRAGHTVTVFEKDDRLGGLCRYGIPDFKLEKWVLDRRLEILAAEGIEFRTGVTADPQTLKADYDAVLIATGAQVPRDVSIPGRDLNGIHYALSYLNQQNRVVAGDAISAADRIDARGKNVIILGGGDTGSDCLGTAHRQGAKSVKQLQLWAPPPDERAAENPWPQWPIVLRSSSSQEEGGDREFAVTTREFVGSDGNVTGLRVAKTLGSKSHQTGAVLTAESEYTIPADLVILAIGYRITEIKVDERYRTAEANVFAAGDAMRGASLIVWAIMDGREAAVSIDSYLRGGVSVLPTRGRDQYFGGLTYRRQGSENR